MTNGFTLQKVQASTVHAPSLKPAVCIFFAHFLNVKKRLFKEIFTENSVLMYGQYSRAVSDQEWVIVARVRQFDAENIFETKVLYSISNST